MKSSFTYNTLRTCFSLTLMSLVTSEVSANPMEPMEFCRQMCRSPGACDQPAIKAECSVICKPGIWENVANAEMNDTSEAYRTENDPQKRNAMLLNSGIAKCLDKKEIDQPPSPLPPAEMTKLDQHDLCAAAKKAQEEHIEDALMAHKMGTAA